MISRPHRPPATARSRPSRSVRSLSPAVLFAFALQGNAMAGEDPVEAAPDQIVEIKGSKTDEGRLAPSVAARGLPGTVTTITADDIATLAVGRDMSNIFQRVPGVVANNIDQGDTGNGFRMRGFATQGTHGAALAGRDVLRHAVDGDGVSQNLSLIHI